MTLNIIVDQYNNRKIVTKRINNEIMKLHIITKIRISIVIAVAVGLYWIICKNTLYNNNEYPIRLLDSANSNIFTYIMLILTSILATVAAFFIGGKNTRYIAPLAAPFALLLPAIFSPDMTKLLVTRSTEEARCDMFTGMIFETVLWYIPVLIGLIIVAVLNKKFTKQKVDVETNTNEKNPKFGTDIPKCIISMTIASVISIIVLPHLCKGDMAEMFIAGTPFNLSTAVSIGQQAFAVTATFFIAVMATHQLIGATGKAFIPIPIIVAAFFYMKGDTNTWSNLAENGVPPFLIHPGMTTLTILPITYAVFGSFGIAWGYWNSYKLHYARENNLIQVK